MIEVYQPSAKAQRSSPMSSVQQNVIKHKIGLLNLASELGNVSRACKVMGFSRDTFYRYQAAVEAGGVETLIDANRRSPTSRTASKRRRRQLSRFLPWSSRLLVKFAFPTNCAKAESSFLHLVFVRCGCARIWSRSKSVCQPWKSMSPRLGWY